MIDLFKQHEGLNTDIIYSGAVLYMEANYDQYVGDSEITRNIKCNVYVIHSSPINFGFKDLQGMRSDTMVEVSYADIKSGKFRITELRLLK